MGTFPAVLTTGTRRPRAATIAARTCVGFCFTLCVLKGEIPIFLHLIDKRPYDSDSHLHNGLDSCFQITILPIFAVCQGAFMRERRMDFWCRGFIHRFQALVFKPLVLYLLDDISVWNDEHRIVLEKTDLAIGLTIYSDNMNQANCISSTKRPKLAWTASGKRCSTKINIAHLSLSSKSAMLDCTASSNVSANVSTTFALILPCMWSLQDSTVLVASALITALRSPRTGAIWL